MDNKNKELLKELKTLKGKFGDVDIDELTKAKEELETIRTKKQEEEGEYKKLYTKAQKDKEKEISDLTKKLESANEGTKSLRKETQITSALSKANIMPEMMDAAKLIVGADVALTDENVAMVGDKTVEAFVADWTATEVGKRFVSEGNKGGGARGPGQKGDPEALFFDPNSKEFNMSKQADIANKDNARYEKLKAAAPEKQAPGQQQ